MSLYTSQDLARELGVTVQTICGHCRALKLRKVGRDYIMAEHDAEMVRDSVRRAKPGRPPK